MNKQISTLFFYDLIEQKSSKKRNEMAGPTGVEPATLGLKVRCSSLTELRTRA